MNTLKWIILSENVFLIYDKNFKAIAYAPLKGEMCTVEPKNVKNILQKGELGKATLEELLDELKSKGMLSGNEELEPYTSEGYNPTSSMISLTRDCNLACIYCYACAGAQNINLKWKVIKTSIKMLKKNALKLEQNYFGVAFHGTGETLMKKFKFIMAVLYAKLIAGNKLKINFGLVTNGTLITPFIAHFLAINDFYITVSMDGPKDIQNLQRPKKDGSGSYEDLIRGIKLIKKSKCRFMIRVTATGTNINKLNELVHIVCKHGCKRIVVEPYAPIGRGKSGVTPLTPEMFLAGFLKAKEVANKYQASLELTEADITDVGTYYCGAVGSNCELIPEGNITTCSRVTKRSDPLFEIFCIGKIEKNQIEINREIHKKLELLSVNYVPECQECYAKYICKGGCPHDRLTYEGPREEWCQVIRFIIWKELEEQLSE